MNYETRCSVAYRQGFRHPIGFYTLCLKEESSTLFVNNKKFLSRYFKPEKIIAAHIKWAGVDTIHQREGIGSLILGKALDDFYEVATRTGVFVLTLTAINNSAEMFYRGLGFQSIEGHPRMMNLAIEDLIATRRKLGLI